MPSNRGGSRRASAGHSHCSETLTCSRTARAARERYAAAYPELFVDGHPKVNDMNFGVAIDLALVLRSIGEQKRADQLLEGSRQVVARYPRMGEYGYGISDSQISAIRGDTDQALTDIRNAERAGWRGPFWRYYRDIDPALASIRKEPEFKVFFADVERDLARQRAELAARSKDGKLELWKSTAGARVPNALDPCALRVLFQRN